MQASWPVEHGGKGLTTLEQVVLNEELARAGASSRPTSSPTPWWGPTLLRWGTQEQKRRSAPPPTCPSMPACPALLPMKQDRIEVHPIRQLDGSWSFSEVFIRSARCPEANVVGGLNNGWKVAMASLDLERGASATASHRRFQRELDRLIEMARHTGKAHEPLVRQRLAQAWSKVKIMQVNGYRTLTAALRDERSADGVAATAKMFWCRSTTER